MSSSPERPSSEDISHYEGYHPRNVDEFHKEANVLAGHDPAEVTADPPANLAVRRVLVFSILAVAGVLAVVLAMGLISIPDCENPQYNWMPCVPDF